MPYEERITVTVRLFAAPREFLGKSEIEVSLPSCAKLADLIELLDADYPGLEKYLLYSKLAVNHTLCTPQMTLNDRDKVALLPPVGGG